MNVLHDNSRQLLKKTMKRKVVRGPFFSSYVVIFFVRSSEVYLNKLSEIVGVVSNHELCECRFLVDNGISTFSCISSCVASSLGHCGGMVGINHSDEPTIGCWIFKVSFSSHFIFQTNRVYHVINCLVDCDSARPKYNRWLTHIPFSRSLLTPV